MRHFRTEQLSANESKNGDDKEEKGIDSKLEVIKLIRDLIARLKGRRP